MTRFAYKILVYTSVLLFLIYYLRAALPYIEYEINKEYIAENLCQNKDSPMMNCKGKCYLKKQVKKAEKKEKKQNSFITIENSLFSNLSIKIIECIDGFNEINKEFILNKLYSFQYMSELLKPPQHIV